MNIYRIKKRYARLKSLQSDLEKPKLTRRDHAKIAEVVTERIELVRLAMRRDWQWAWGEFLKMEGHDAH